MPQARTAQRSGRRRSPAASLARAEPGALPRTPRPQLAWPAEHPPAGKDYLHEIKFDGYRTLVRVDSGQVKLFTRNGLDWTQRYGRLAAAFAALPCDQALIDGEIVVQDAQGRSSFAGLQDALARGNTTALLFYAFDLVHLDGFDLSATPLGERRRTLASLLAGERKGRGPLQLSEHVVGDGPRFFAAVCRLGLEGIVSKRLDCPYRAGRSRSWLKIKCENGETFMVVGFTATSAKPVAALLLAEWRDEALVYAGKVSAAMPAPALRKLHDQLRALQRSDPPLDLPRGFREPVVTWVEPRLPVEVTFASRTRTGLLRHPSYKGIRADLAGPERATGTKAPKDSTVVSKAKGGAMVAVTHPDRIMFGAGGPTKLDLARYYAAVAEAMLPELARRPVSLVRCPSGAVGECFFQRHLAAGMPAGLQSIRLREERSRRPGLYVYLEDAGTLLQLVQVGAVEFHPWGCRVDAPERPDRLVFDLDPAADVRWPAVVDAAVELRAALTALGLVPFVKTTGGKGLHVVVPIQPRHDWPTVRRFCQTFAAALAASAPQRYTALLAKNRRNGRIFIDYLRNDRGATAVAAYSLRARPGAPVAMPIAWGDLRRLDGPAAFDYRSALRHIARRRRDPWADMGGSARSLTDPLARLEAAGRTGHRR